MSWVNCWLVYGMIVEMMMVVDRVGWVLSMLSIVVVNI